MDPYGDILDDGKTTVDIKPICAYGTKIMEVVYTNNVNYLKHMLEKFEQLLEKETYNFLGLDLEYTRNRRDEAPSQQLAVVQNTLKETVLMFYYCR